MWNSTEPPLDPPEDEQSFEEREQQLTEYYEDKEEI